MKAFVFFTVFLSPLACAHNVRPVSSIHADKYRASGLTTNAHTLHTPPNKNTHAKKKKNRRLLNDYIPPSWFSWYSDPTSDMQPNKYPTSSAHRCFEYDVDYTQNNLYYQDAVARDVDCQKLCQMEAQCGGFIYDAHSRRCSLSAQLMYNTRVYRQGYVSGPKVCQHTDTSWDMFFNSFKNMFQDFFAAPSAYPTPSMYPNQYGRNEYPNTYVNSEQYDYNNNNNYYNSDNINNDIENQYLQNREESGNYYGGDDSGAEYYNRHNGNHKDEIKYDDHNTNNNEQQHILRSHVDYNNNDTPDVTPVSSGGAEEDTPTFRDNNNSPLIQDNLNNIDRPYNTDDKLVFVPQNEPQFDGNYQQVLAAPGYVDRKSSAYDTYNVENTNDNSGYFEQKNPQFNTNEMSGYEVGKGGQNFMDPFGMLFGTMMNPADMECTTTCSEDGSQCQQSCS